jgi:hypothetical protein
MMGGKVRSFFKLRKAAEEGQKGAEFDLFLARLDLGQFKLAEARQQAQEIGQLSDKQQKQLNAALFNVEINEQFVYPSREAARAIELGEQWFELARQKRVPTSSDAAAKFWSLIEFYGDEKRNSRATQMAKVSLKKLEKGR